MASDLLLVSDDRINDVAVRTLTINQPARRNCLSMGLMDAMIDAMRDAPGAMIAIRGHEVSFCTGLDLDEMYELGTAEPHLRKLIDLMCAIAMHARPTVALTSGFAYGGGAALLCTCDVAVASPSARIKLPNNHSLRPLVDAVVPILGCRRGLPGKRVADLIGTNCTPAVAMEEKLIDLVSDSLEWDAIWPDVSRLLLSLQPSPRPAIDAATMTQTQELITHGVRPEATKRLIDVLALRYRDA